MPLAAADARGIRRSMALRAERKISDFFFAFSLDNSA